ncbi:MAG: phage regulatory CII family protein, partial [Bilophila wadsworthia]
MRGTCGFPSLRQCVHASVLGCDTLDGKGIAERLGLNYQTFMSSVSGQPKHKLDADWLLPIMATTGSVEPLQFMAREMGGVFVKVK